MAFLTHLAPAAREKAKLKLTTRIQWENRPAHSLIGKNLEVTRAGTRRVNIIADARNAIVCSTVSYRRLNADCEELLGHNALTTKLPQIKRRRWVARKENLYAAAAHHSAGPHVNLRSVH